MLNKLLLTNFEEEDIGNIQFQQDGAMCHTAEASLDVLHPVFEDHIISHRADVWWCLATSEMRFHTVRLLFDALKENIREAIGEIQLYIIDKVLKNWNDRVGYGMASWGSHLNEIIFHY